MGDGQTVHSGPFFMTLWYIKHLPSHIIITFFHVTRPSQLFACNIETLGLPCEAIGLLCQSGFVLTSFELL